jgi:hypothetical protein
MVWCPSYPPSGVSARGFAEGGGVMQRLAGQTDSEISACSEMGSSRRRASSISTVSDTNPETPMPF